MSPEEEIKRIQIGKDVKLSVFADYMILYIRDPKKNPSRNNRETIKKLSNMASYRINWQKSITFYAPTTNIEKEIMDTLQFIVVQRK